MKPQHFALALVVALIWGFTMVTGKIGVSHFPPMFFTALRFGLVALVLLPWLKLLPGRMRDIMVIGLCAGSLHFGLFYYGMSLSPSLSSVAILVQLGTPFSVMLAVLWLKERLDARRIGGIALAFVGVMLLGFDPVVFEYPLSTALVIVAAFTMSVAMTMMRRLRNVGVFQLQAWIASLSAPPMLLGSLLFEDGQYEKLMNPNWLAVGAVVFTSLATSIVGHGGWYYLLQRYSVSQVSGFGLLPPVLSVAFAVTLFNEPVGWELIAAAVLVTAGLAAITLPAKVWGGRAK